LRQDLLGQSAIFLKRYENADAEFSTSREALLEALQDPGESDHEQSHTETYQQVCGELPRHKWILEPQKRRTYQPG
jgi:hypothetical protein